MVKTKTMGTIIRVLLLPGSPSLLTLPTMLRPNRKRAVAEKALPSVVKMLLNTGGTGLPLTTKVPTSIPRIDLQKESEIST